ncbi:ribonucleotide reductase [Pseudomonas phage PAE1]|uniref:ribonucleoside-diphosphate reductase n=2 Tax=Yuavirus TaxID=1299429 RepID=A0A0N9ERC7_9CAUD|nr:ribonucleotide reductase [Pseudomonas phage PAE1]ALF51538.1 putative ribonucleotide reductase [Pseudomonas phage PAE1]WNV49156.1 ribonucleotide reductase of class Ib (aerobic), alpha subunit [Pseudomonas phage Chuck]WPK38621.1 ribonucleoside-diphosphate reductase large subunit [Pseudomonas phage Aergia]
MIESPQPFKETRKMHGPQVPYSQELHAQKYRGSGESFREAMNRIAAALKDDDQHFADFRDALLGMRFLPAGRIQSAMGSTRQVTPYNCYVSGTINDSFVDGEGSIMVRAAEAAATMRMGGGIGYDFSTLRPRGDLIRKLQSHSSGPISFMHIFDAICKCVASSGHRRGAQMGVMRVDHPDIEEFIHAKQPGKDVQPLWDLVAELPEGAQKQQLVMSLQQTLKLTGFNVSVAITDKFMECVASGEPFPLTFEGRTYREVDARALWDAIMRGTWDWAEPGVLFIDAINRMNNLWYCETIAATNPCGEQPLPPYGACLLGSFNLVKYIFKDGAGRYAFDWDQYREDIPQVVRAMDNVVDRAIYPLPQQKQEAKDKRRMGLGITGLANAAEALGHEYGSPAFLAFEAEVLDTLRDESYLASAHIAKVKGSFPKFDKDKYLQGQFIKTLREDVRDAIAKYGIRNSHLTSIAPTGTISLCADNVSSGIEPVFAYSFDRTVIEFSGPRVETVEDYGARVFGVRGKACSRVTVQEHVAALTVAAQRVDSAVSKTCNVPSDISWEDFKNVYVSAWEGGAKGCTTFRLGGKRSGILVVKDDGGEPEADAPAEEPASQCRIDPATGRRECE